MGTTKVTVRRTARKKDGSSKGTVTRTSRTTVNGQKVIRSGSRKITGKSADVGYIKGS